jgi:hypothetical protein
LWAHEKEVVVDQGHIIAGGLGQVGGRGQDGDGHGGGFAHGGSLAVIFDFRKIGPPATDVKRAALTKTAERTGRAARLVLAAESGY